MRAGKLLELSRLMVGLYVLMSECYVRLIHGSEDVGYGREAEQRWAMLCPI